MAVGEALSAWQKVENGVFCVFFNCLASPSMGAASIVFTGVENFRTKLNLTDALARFRLRKFPAELAEWETLKAKTDTLIKTRNVLAHHKVTWFQIGRIKPVPVLVPPDYDLTVVIRDGSFEKQPTLRTKQIIHIMKEFVIHGSELDQFSQRIPPLLAQNAEDRGSPANQTG